MTKISSIGNIILFSFFLFILCINDKVVFNKKDKTFGNFIVVFSLPEYVPKANDILLNKIFNPLNIFEKKSIRTLGHGGCVLIFKNGNCILYEFGKYNSDKYGSVIKKNLGKIGIVKNDSLVNLRDVLYFARKFTENKGYKYRMESVLLSLPNIKRSFEFAEIENREYSLIDLQKGGGMNCATYSLEVAIHGDIETDFTYFATPKKIVNHLKKSKNFLKFEILE